MRSVRAGVASLLLWSLPSCDASTAPPFPSDALYSFGALPRYALWWNEVEACSHRTSDLSSIHWFETLGNPIALDGGLYDGFWWAADNRIALQNRYDGPTVRHEMLHALLRRGDHPLSVFAGACGGVVRFDESDLTTILPALVAITRPVVPSEALSVTVSTDPAVLRASDYEGWFTVIVTASNRTSWPIWIVLPSDYSASYVFQEDGLAGTLMLTKAKAVFFAPGQQRRVYLDSYVDFPGIYHIRAEYAGAVSPWTAITVSP